MAVLLLLLAGLGVTVILIARMLIIYSTYALLPLLMGFQLVEIGPWKRVNTMGEKFIKTSGKLMLFGVVVAALIWGGTLMANLSAYDTPSNTFAGGEAVDGGVDGSFASVTMVDLLRDFFMLITPLLIIDAIGLKLIMGLL